MLIKWDNNPKCHDLPQIQHHFMRNDNNLEFCHQNNNYYKFITFKSMSEILFIIIFHNIYIDIDSSHQKVIHINWYYVQLMQSIVSKNYQWMKININTSFYNFINWQQIS